MVDEHFNITIDPADSHADLSLSYGRIEFWATKSGVVLRWTCGMFYLITFKEFDAFLETILTLRDKRAKERKRLFAKIEYLGLETIHLPDDRLTLSTSYLYPILTVASVLTKQTIRVYTGELSDSGDFAEMKIKDLIKVIDKLRATPVK